MTLRERLPALGIVTSALLLVAACGGDSASGSTTDSTPAPSATSEQASATTEGSVTATTAAQVGDECPSLTSADVEAITGVAVVAVPRGSNEAAGGLCANYETADGAALIGINVLAGADTYELSFPPEGAYQPAEELAGIGDEAVGFRLLEGWPFSYVVAREGENVVVVFSMSQDITDVHMTQMATKALG